MVNVRSAGDLWSRRVHDLRTSVRDRRSAGTAGATPAPPGILDEYVHSAPNGQVALDIFEGEWNSKLPPPYEACSGTSELFDDARITWAEQLLGGIDGYRVLELGPLEAGHTTMMEQAGAASITAIEANTRSYLKCLVVKELVGLRRSSFLCGDFMEYLRASSDRFDLCVASGVLYHMQDPIEALRLIGGSSDRLLLWTHFYDEDWMSRHPDVREKFTGQTPKRFGGWEYVEYRYQYGAALDWRGFCGGSAPFSNWITRQAILSCLGDLGFDSLEIGFDDRDHPHGPAFSVLARRSSETGIRGGGGPTC